MEQPLYKHFDCAWCSYLGRYHDGERWNDLYRCRGFVLARWGDDLDDYVAILQCSVSRSCEDMKLFWPGIVEAHRRSVA